MAVLWDIAISSMGHFCPLILSILREKGGTTMNQTLERIEFNLHTAASDDASIITPKEAVRKARSLGQTAFAVTSLNSVQDYYELEK